MTTTLFLSHDDDRGVPLHAAGTQPTASDGVVPVATAAQFVAFLSRWAANDPNGTWNPAGVVEADGALIYSDEAGREVWTVADIVDGTPAYALAGWQWVAA